MIRGSTVKEDELRKAMDSEQFSRQLCGESERKTLGEAMLQRKRGPESVSCTVADKTIWQKL